MKFKILSLVASVALVLAIGSTAKADTFSCSGTVLTLEQSLAGGGSAVADLCVSGDTVTMYGLSLNGSATTGAKVFAIAWTGSTTPSGDVSGSSNTFANDGNTWAAESSPNADGWSKYDNVWKASSVSSDNYTGDGSLVWTFTADPGTDFALHIGGFAKTTCSVWVSTRWSTDNQDTNDQSCGGGTTVPEPSSLMLFGTGLLGMAGFLRRKLMS